MTGELDALVVGAGPAGSVAALTLARAGVRVGLVDRARFPRDKLCGDTLNPGSLAILDELGLGEDIRGRALPVSGMVVTGPGGASVASDYPDNLRGAAIARRDLDLTVLEAAVAAGARFVAGVHAHAPLLAADRVAVTGVRMGAASEPAELRARVVIAADGRRSKLAAALQLTAPVAPRRWAFGAYFRDVEGLTSRGEMHIRSDGYIGVAPLPDGLANVCVVRKGFSRKDLIGAIAADPALRERFARARQVTPLASLGPLAVEARTAGCPGLLLAGDAAGFVDPMTGDGLRFAFRGGQLAAEAALQELATGVPAFTWLGRARVREFSGKWRVNRALRSLVASPRGIACAAAIAARWPAPVRALIGVAGDVHLARRLACSRS